MPRAKRSPRDSYLTVTLRPEERVAVERAAMASGNKMSSWVRWAILRALPKKSEIAETPAAVEEIPHD